MTSQGRISGRLLLLVYKLKLATGFETVVVPTVRQYPMRELRPTCHTYLVACNLVSFTFFGFSSPNTFEL